MTERRRAQIWFFLGILAVLIMGIPYIILGQDAIFVYHDQLDGEVIAYLLKARHLWDGSGILPEFMNGAAKTALTLPAPACVLLYRWLPAWAALACMQVIGSLTGYVGMFLLIRYVARSEERLSHRQGMMAFVAMAVGCLYAYLPFCRYMACHSMDCRCYYTACSGWEKRTVTERSILQPGCM